MIKPSGRQSQPSKRLVKLNKKTEWALLKDAQTVTADGGKHFELAASISTPKDVEGVNEVQKLLDLIANSCIWILELPN